MTKYRWWNFQTKPASTNTPIQVKTPTVIYAKIQEPIQVKTPTTLYAKILET